MKKKEKISLSHASKEELEKEVNALRAKSTSLRLDRYTKQMKNTRERRQLRKKIAILQTFIRQKAKI